MLNIFCMTPRGYFGSNMYILESIGEFAVVDPSVEYQSAVKLYSEIEGKIKYILLTHCHFDHIVKIDSWAQTGAEVIIGKEDRAGLADPYFNCYLGFLGLNEGYFGEARSVEDNQVLPLGGENIRVIACPGHTPGGVSYRIGDNIFVGDTVFAGGGYGRCDLPGSDIDVLEKSIIRLITKENDAVLYPGHGDKTTLQDFIKHFM